LKPFQTKRQRELPPLLLVVHKEKEDNGRQRAATSAKAKRNQVDLIERRGERCKTEQNQNLGISDVE